MERFFIIYSINHRFSVYNNNVFAIFIRPTCQAQGYIRSRRQGETGSSSARSLGRSVCDLFGASGCSSVVPAVVLVVVVVAVDSTSTVVTRSCAGRSLSTGFVGRRRPGQGNCRTLIVGLDERVPEVGIVAQAVLDEAQKREVVNAEPVLVEVVFLLASDFVVLGERVGRKFNGNFTVLGGASNVLFELLSSFVEMPIRDGDQELCR